MNTESIHIHIHSGNPLTELRHVETASEVGLSLGPSADRAVQILAEVEAFLRDAADGMPEEGQCDEEENAAVDEMLRMADALAEVRAEITGSGSVDSAPESRG